MTFQALPRHTSLFLLGDLVEAGGGRFRKTVVVSLLLHLCLLSVIMGAKLFKKTERPMSAVEVSLVSLPAVETKPEPKVEKVVPRPTPKPVQSAPIPVPPKPVQQPTPPPPVQAAPAVKPVPPAPVPPPAPTPRLPAPTLTAPQPIPQAAKSPSSAPITNRADVLRDVMKDIELPPNAPQYGDLAPMKPAEVKRAAQPRLERTSERSDLDAMLKKLKVPEMAAAQVPVEAPPEAPKPTAVPPKRASLSEEMNNDLDRELKDLKKLQTLPPVKYSDPVREIKPMFREPQPAVNTPPLTASIPRTKPETRLRIPGVAGSNPYLALVQSRIRKFWEPPDVGVLATPRVVVKFRLERNGQVSSIAIEESSGNDYYDMSAQRAIRSAVPLPPFPHDLTDSFFDAHFTFFVGEAAG
jgi:colicin import membrane protein